jgi:hypothetical protein
MAPDVIVSHEVSLLTAVHVREGSVEITVVDPYEIEAGALAL